MAWAWRDHYGPWMTRISFTRHRFPSDIIQHAVWPYARYTLSFRDVEDLLAERGIDVSNETVRRWLWRIYARFHARFYMETDIDSALNNPSDNVLLPGTGGFWPAQVDSSATREPQFASDHA